MNIIETTNLKCRFGHTEAVSDLTLEVPEGSVYAFLGPNGAGKTTTIKMLLNILRPTAGEARVLGLSSTELGPPQLAQIGYVSENQQLPEWMTVAQLLAYCRPFYPTWDDAFCQKLLADFELPTGKKLRSLSRGMKVKAALVSSLAYRPRLLVLDEPFSGLDPLVRDEFIRGILELAEQDGWSIFVSSHDIDEVERLADHVGVIDRGRLHLSETTESLQARFRRVDFAVEHPPERWPSAVPPPPSWLVPDLAGHRVRFVESQYRPGETEREIRERFPGASEPLIEPLSLREIFLTLARTFRFQAEI
jgi:ABC-type multidrug transport system ATPase subunit